MNNFDHEGAGANSDKLGSGDETAYMARRRDLMKKIAAGAVATPVVLSSVTAQAAIISTPLPPT